MNRSSALLATLVLSMSYAVGCGEDVGTCNDSNEGRDVVLVGTTIQYAGQAIVNKSCTSGCHNSTVTGENRRGAPAGLDFDVVPVSEDKAKGKKKSSDTIVKLSTAQLDGLRKRQKVIYENRDSIWQQVREGLMPPDGMFAMFSSLKGIFATKDGEPCEQGKQYSDLGDQKETLRNWLACGAPIVESAGAVVTEPHTPGVVGYQYPLCEPAEGDSVGLVSGPVTLEKLFKAQFTSCTQCHPLLGKPDFRSVEAAVMTMMDVETEICDGKPYVTKGEPDSSFLYDLVSKDDPGCGHSRMPQFAPELDEEQLAQVREWIEKGAPITDDDVTEEPGDEPGDEEPVDQEPGDEEPGDEEPVLEDAGVEPPRDAGRGDAGGDAGRDAGRDAAVVDAGRDAGRRLF